jgi:hypothetical protein
MKKKKYLELHWLDQGLDAIVIVAIVGGLGLLAFELLFTGVSFSQPFNVFVIAVLFVDMGRTFLKSKNFIDYAKHHWIDLVLVSLMIIAFSSVLYLGIGRISWLLREEKLLRLFR